MKWTKQFKFKVHPKPLTDTGPLDDNAFLLKRNALAILRSDPTASADTPRFRSQTSLLFRQLAQRAKAANRLPSDAAMTILQAALRTPDHRRPKDWRRILYFTLPPALAKQSFPDIQGTSYTYTTPGGPQTNSKRRHSQRGRLPGSFGG